MSFFDFCFVCWLIYMLHICNLIVLGFVNLFEKLLFLYNFNLFCVCIWVYIIGFMRSGDIEHDLVNIVDYQFFFACVFHDSVLRKLIWLISCDNLFFIFFKGFYFLFCFLLMRPIDLYLFILRVDLLNSMWYFYLFFLEGFFIYFLLIRPIDL
jgi:hypothetical protein